MKYSQFLQLVEILEKQDSNISKFKGSEYKIFEADDTEQVDTQKLDTEKTTVAGRAVSRWVRMKNKLNKVGKDTQNQLMNKVLNKYFPQVLQKEKEFVTGYQKQNKKDLKDFVQKYRQSIQTQQTKQVSIIEGAIDKFLENVTTRMNNKIDSSQITDKNKVKVKNYWILLTTQISMNASTYMINERTKVLQTLFDEQAAKKAAAETFKAEKNNLATKQKNVKNKEQEIKQGEAQGNKETSKPEVGKKYKYTTAKNQEYTLEITKINADGSLQAKTPDGKLFTIPADKVKKLVAIQEKTETPKTQTTQK